MYNPSLIKEEAAALVALEATVAGPHFLGLGFA